MASQASDGSLSLPKVTGTVLTVLFDFSGRFNVPRTGLPNLLEKGCDLVDYFYRSLAPFDAFCLRGAKSGGMSG